MRVKVPDRPKNKACRYSAETMNDGSENADSAPRRPRTIPFLRRSPMMSWRAMLARLAMMRSSWTLMTNWRIPTMSAETCEEEPISPPMPYSVILSQIRTMVPESERMVQMCHLRMSHEWVEAICFFSSREDASNSEITGSGGCRPIFAE